MCVGCGVAVDKGTRAWWDADANAVWCLPCHAEPPPSSPGPGPRPADPGPAPPAPVVDRGTPGTSARAEHARRHAKRERRLEQRWGRFAGVAKAVSDDPTSTRVWAKGAAAEERVGRFLERRLGGRAVVLCDRKVPGTRGNLDLLVVAASGVWIVDVKNYQGRIRARDVGGWRKTDLRLYVNGRDCTALADAMGWQTVAVATGLEDPDVPLTAVLCFDDAQWGLWGKPFTVRGVLVTWARKLAERIDRPGPLDPGRVEALAADLSRKLPAN